MIGDVDSGDACGRRRAVIGPGRREAEADAGKGPIGRRLAAVAAMAAMGLLAIGIGFGTVAMLGSKPAPQAEVAPPPPSPTELGLSEFVARERSAAVRPESRC